MPVQDATGYGMIEVAGDSGASSPAWLNAGHLAVHYWFHAAADTPGVGGLPPCFIAAFLFTIVTLPVELDASRRAMAMLSSNRLIATTEYSMAKSVLRCCALTYVAAGCPSAEPGDLLRHAAPGCWTAQRIRAWITKSTKGTKIDFVPFVLACAPFATQAPPLEPFLPAQRPC